MEINAISSTVGKYAVPLKSTESYTSLLQAVGDAEVVMIGEASHGTHEFYQQRAEITKQLILQKGFTFIAVEADWPDAYRANRYVQNGKKADKTAKGSLNDFKRFPMWMWRNTVILEFIEWLRKHNDKTSADNDPHKKVAFYGMDLYSFYSSMDAVVEYLEQVSPEDAKIAKKRYALFERFQGEPSSYGYAAGFGLTPSFEKEVVSTLVDLQKKGEIYLKGKGGLIDGDELFYTEQNARLVKNAEEYYRKMYHADEVTWNLRDGHMVDAISNLFEFHKRKLGDQRQEKVVIWAHNSHLGDARATEAGKRRGELNVGQLMREKYGLNKTFNIGFSTFNGSVTAAKNWDEPAQLDIVRNGIYDSYEHILHEAAQALKVPDYYLLFRSNNSSVKVEAELVDKMMGPRYERYIGVIYRPDTEKASHYCQTNLPKEYDAVIFLDRTRALEPLDKTAPWEKQHRQSLEINMEDTYPELEPGSRIPDELLEWRLTAAAKLNQIGIELMQKGDVAAAAQKFEKAAKYVEYNLAKFQTRRNLQELRFQILLNRADAHFQLRSWNQVIRDCNTVLSLKPANPQAHLLIAKAYDEKGDPREAKHHYEMAAKEVASHPRPIISGLEGRR